MEFTLAERDKPSDAAIRNFRGIALAQLGRSSEAAAEYHEAIRLDAGLEAAYRNLGFLEWNKHQLDLSRASLEAALACSPNDAFAHYYLARVQLESQQYETAFRELQRSGMPLPDEPDVQMLAARGYIALGRNTEALQVARQLVPRQLTDTQTSSLASLLLAMHENSAAVQLLQRTNEAVEGDKKSWVNFDLSLAYLFAGNYQQAADMAIAYTNPTKSPPTSAQAAEAWSLLGIAHSHRGNAEETMNAFRRSTILAPEREEYWLNQTRELMELSRFTDAISTTQEAIVLHPDSYALQLRLGAANLAVSHYVEAEAVFRRLILAGDPLPTSYVGLAQVLLRTGRAEEAVVELAAAKKAIGPSFLLSYFEGLACNRAGEPADATAAFTEAVQENPGSAEAHFELGKTELKQAQYDQAILQLESAHKLNPADLPTSRLLQQAHLRSGDKNGAQQLPEALPETITQVPDLIGDFILPQWQEPPAVGTPPQN